MREKLHIQLTVHFHHKEQQILCIVHVCPTNGKCICTHCHTHVSSWYTVLLRTRAGFSPSGKLVGRGFNTSALVSKTRLVQVLHKSPEHTWKCTVKILVRGKRHINVHLQGLKLTWILLQPAITFQTQCIALWETKIIIHLFLYCDGISVCTSPWTIKPTCSRCTYSSPSVNPLASAKWASGNFDPWFPILSDLFIWIFVRLRLIDLKCTLYTYYSSTRSDGLQEEGNKIKNIFLRIQFTNRFQSTGVTYAIEANVALHHQHHVKRLVIHSDLIWNSTTSKFLAWHSKLIRTEIKPIKWVESERVREKNRVGGGGGVQPGSAGGCIWQTALISCESLSVVEHLTESLLLIEEFAKNAAFLFVLPTLLLETEAYHF